MDKERLEALEWFVEFANMNLDELKPGDKAKLLVESEEYLSPTKDLEQAGLGNRPVSDNFYNLYASKGLTRKDVEKIRMGSMAWAIEIPERNTPEYWDTLKGLQKTVIETFGEILGFSQAQFDSSVPPGTRLTGIGWQGVMMIQVTWDRTFDLSFVPLAGTYATYIQLKIYQLLNGFPRQAIEKCQGCEKYFLNATFRKKRFCSSRCMWRVNAERWREKIKKGENKEKREEYLDKQSGMMIKRYDKKRKDEGYKKTTRYQSKRSKTRKGV